MILNEKKILNIIKYMPILFIFILFFVVTEIILYKTNKNLKNDIHTNETLYLKNNKNRVKEEIERIYKQIKIERKDIENSLFENSENLLKEKLLKRIRNIRFGKTGYVFVYNIDGTCLAHFKPKFIGVNRIEVKDKNGNFVVKNVLDFAKKNKQGFMSYIATAKPNEKTTSRKKISYVKLFDDWNWVIGTGFYLDSLNNQINEEEKKLIKSNNELIKEIVYISILLTVFLSIVSFYFSAYIEKIFINYKIKIKEQNNTLLKAQEVAHIGDWKLDLKTNKALWSDEIIRIFGINKKDKDQFGPDYLKKLIIDEDISCFEGSINKCINGGEEHECIYRIKRPDNKIRWIDCRGRLDESKSFVIGTAQDITEKQESLKLLQQKKKEFETIIQEAPNPMSIHNEDGEILIINKSWEKLTGYTYEEINTVNKWTTKAYGEKMPIVKEYIDTLYDITEKTDNGQFDIISKNGDIVTWQIFTAPLGLVNEKRTIITSCMDITELKQKDEMLINQSRHAAMGEMIGMIAHQWRQPLSIIAMDTNNMLADIELDDFNTDSSKQYANNISKQVQHLSETIDDFRNFFKEDKEIAKVNIKDILNQTLVIVQDSLRNNDIELISIFQTDKEANVYPRELMQVLVNIITNAKDALSENKIKNAQININVAEDKKYINITICDNGGGIDIKILPKVFDPYFSTKSEKNGTGLGLYMSKLIIEEHLNGIIEVFNCDNGACFTVRLLK